MTLVFEDRVYGKITITEREVLDVINTPTFQRLRKIGMAGYELFLSQNHPLSKLRANRFEHSIGVWYLLKTLGASREEKIAGLLHDISILALAHIGDCVFGRFETQDYHDEIKSSFLEQTEIPRILAKHGIDIKDVLDETKFGLLDRKHPDLCADRIDYSLRHLVELRKIDREEVRKILASLRVYNGEIVFSSFNVARQFAYHYLYLNQNYYCTPLQASVFTLIAQVVREGMEKGIIDEVDLFTTDDVIYRKLQSCDDEEIRDALRKIHNLAVVEESNDYEMHVVSKARWIDPKVIKKGKIYRVSEIDEGYKTAVMKWLDTAKRGFKVRII